MTMLAADGAPAIDLDPADWAEVRRILRQHVPDLEVWAFGSRAKGTAKRYSDLDLVLIATQPLSLQRRADLAEAFATSDLPIRVDVVNWAVTSDRFKQIIAQDKVVLQVSEHSGGCAQEHSTLL